jgi:hypothetical protein
MLAWQLHVNITKRTLERAHRLPNLHRPPGPDDAEVEGVVERPVAARRLVEHGHGQPELCGARLGREVVLPRPPVAVDAGVVQPEDGVAWAHVEVAAGVAAVRVVAARVHAEDAGRAVRVARRLEARLEGGEVGRVGDEVGDVAVVGRVRGHEGVYVAPLAARVVAAPVLPRVVLHLHPQLRDGPNVDGPVDKGAGEDAAAAAAPGQHQVALQNRGRLGVETGAAHARLAAVEDGALERRCRVSRVVPIW